MSTRRPCFQGPLAALLLGVGTWLCAGEAQAADGDCPPRLRAVFPDFAVPPIFHGTGAEFPDPPGQLVDFFAAQCSTAVASLRWNWCAGQSGACTSRLNTRRSIG